MKVKLKKIVSKHNNLRTNEVIGELLTPLAVGSNIIIVSDPLDSTKDYRELRTTTVRKIEGNRYFTENSVYEITVFDENQQVS